MTNNGNGNIPFVDLVALHREIEFELAKVFQSCVATAGFIGGPLVETFERDFAAYCKAQHCVGVNSGTDALRFALIAAGVQPGDIVVTVPLTFIATTEAISQVGARPEFVDVDPRTYTIDPANLRSYLENQCVLDPQTGRWMHRRLRRPVTAVVPVHLYGQTAAMDPILDLAKHYKLMVIEDACQAHGAEYFSRANNSWRAAGSMGHAAAFSFYPGKNLGACGEGGAVTTGDEKIANKVKMLRDHGQSKRYYHDVEGYNGRLDSIQAGILSVKLKGLTEGNNKRVRAAEFYDEHLSRLSGVVTPWKPQESRPVYHLYVIRVRDRDRLQAQLADAGIGTGIHYPIPLHLQKAYETLGYGNGAFPVAEAAASTVLSLPMYPHLQAEQQQRVISEVRRFLASSQENVEQSMEVSPAVGLSRS